MFERFTDRARRVVVLAQEEARLLNHNYIGTEHILLGLIHENEGHAAKALKSFDITLNDIRSGVEELSPKGDVSPMGHIPFTPRAKKVLDYSLREALQLGHSYIGTEHILLAIIREGYGVGAKVIVQLGADLPRVRQKVVHLLSDYHGAPTQAKAAPAPTTAPLMALEIMAVVGELMQVAQASISLGTAPDPLALQTSISRLAALQGRINRSVTPPESDAPE